MKQAFSAPLVAAVGAPGGLLSNPWSRPVDMASARWLRTRALGWLAVLSPLLGLVYFGAWGHPASSSGWAHRLVASPWTAGPYLAVPVLLAWSLLWSRSSQELRRQGARLFTALLSGTALTWVAALGDAYAPQHAPALHLALVIVLWDWFGRRIHTPGKRLLLHTAALWAAAAAWTSHEAPPDDVATDVVLGALAGVVSVWLWPLARRASLPQAWRWSRDPQRQGLAALHAVAAALCLGAALVGEGLAIALAWPAAALVAVALNYAGFGARGFQLDRHASMDWAARWLFAPYRLASALNARLWTHGQPLAIEIRPGVWLARMPSHRQWTLAGRPLLLSLCAELQAPGGGATRCVPMLDQTPAGRAMLRKAGLVLDAQVATGHPVWVCCARGFSADAAVVAGWVGDRVDLVGMGEESLVS